MWFWNAYFDVSGCSICTVSRDLPNHVQVYNIDALVFQFQQGEHSVCISSFSFPIMKSVVFQPLLAPLSRLEMFGSSPCISLT